MVLIIQVLVMVSSPLISIRFVMGDIIGSLVVIIFLAIFRKVTKDLT